MNKQLRLINSGVLYANPYQGDWAIHAYHPRILEVSPNELICVYRRGSAMYSDDGRSFILRSQDNGDTWQDEGVVWDGVSDEKAYDYSATNLAMMRDGEIILTGYRVHRPEPDMLFYNEKTGTCLPEETILFRSRDKGLTFSAPEVIKKPEGKYLEITGSVVELNNGNWLIPFDIGKAYDDPSHLHLYVLGFISKDRGKTWEELIPIAGSPDYEKTFWHARLIKLADGRVICFPWTGDNNGQQFLSLHRVVSDSDGRNWSKPEPIDIPGQTSCPVDLGNNRMALVYSLRDADQPGIYMVLSEDEGKSWDTEKQVQIWDAYGKESLEVARTATYPSSHDNIAYGAPHATQLTNGDIMSCFWAGQSGQMICRWFRLRVE